MTRTAKYHGGVFHDSVRDISHNWLRLELVEYGVILETEHVMLRDYSDWNTRVRPALLKSESYGPLGVTGLYGFLRRQERGCGGREQD